MGFELSPTQTCKEKQCICELLPLLVYPLWRGSPSAANSRSCLNVPRILALWPTYFRLGPCQTFQLFPPFPLRFLSFLECNSCTLFECALSWIRLLYNALFRFANRTCTPLCLWRKTWRLQIHASSLHILTFRTYLYGLLYLHIVDSVIIILMSKHCKHFSYRCVRTACNSPSARYNVVVPPTQTLLPNKPGVRPSSPRYPHGHNQK